MLEFNEKNTICCRLEENCLKISTLFLSKDNVKQLESCFKEYNVDYTKLSQSNCLYISLDDESILELLLFLKTLATPLILC